MQKFKKVVVGAYALAVAAAGVAYAASFASEQGSLPKKAAEDAETVTATWAMGGKNVAAITSVVSNTEAITNAEFSAVVNYTHADGKTSSVGGRTARPTAELNFPLTTVGSMPIGQRNENVYFQYTITAAQEFTPVSFSLNAWNVKNGAGRFDVVVEYNGTEYVIVEEQKPARTQENSDDKNESKSGYSFEFALSDVPAGTGEYIVRIYPYTSDAATNREIGFSNVTVTGTVAAGQEEPDNCHFHIPGVHELNPIDGDIECTTPARIENPGTADAKFGYLQAGTSVTFKNVHCGQAGGYKVIMPVDWSVGDAEFEVEVTDIASNKIEARVAAVMPKNNSAFQPMEFDLEGRITKGLKNVVYRFTKNPSREAGFNLKAPEFVRTGEGTELGGTEVPAGWMTMPGTVDIAHSSWVLSGLKYESGGNIGYVKNGCSATGEIFCTEAGVYSMNIDFYWFQNAGRMHVEIIDIATGNKEIDTYYNIPEKHVADFILEGVVTPGKKTIRYTFLSESGGFIVNYRNHTLTKIADKFAAIESVSLAGMEPVAFEGFDYAWNLPSDYSAENVTLDVAWFGGAVSAKAGDADVAISADGKLTIPTPAMNEAVELTLTITPEENAVASVTERKVRIYHLGDVLVDAVNVGGVKAGADIVKALNDNAVATLADCVFTTVPAVEATFIDGTVATATVTVEGTNATAVFSGKSGDVTKNFTLTIEGIHTYAKADTDAEATLVFDSGCKGADGNWSNGLYTFTNCNDGWDGKQFKMKGNQTHTLMVPMDMQVKQLVLRELYDNYTPGKIASVTCEGATVWMPTASEFLNGGANARDLICNVENHKAGTPFEITIEGGSQPVAMFYFVYESVAPESAPVMKSVSATSTESANHAVVTFTFDRAMSDATITVNGTEVKADGGGAALSFSLWDLPWSSDVTVEIPAGAASDIYGNATETAYQTVLTVGAPVKTAPMAAERFVEVSNAQELRAAVAALATTNNAADCDWTVIFMRSGDYDLGTQELSIGKGIYNVALVGESREGVLMHGTRSGISNPTFSTRYSTGVYMENFTSRNDLDYGKAERAGVGVAHYGGNLDIMKNVALQSIQDTQVTGERGYYLNCAIHGSVDYICGGGDHYYDNCTIIHEIAGGYVTAPATSPNLKHGYVFQGCTIEGKGSYDLGRPWQNEPRAFFLNTTMKALPNDGGWGGMSSLVTHFYEYNSMDADGKPLDLSKRVNSKTSTNSYSPILPAEYADYFNPRNVLGGKDSWLATEFTQECEAPVVILNDKFQLVWEAVEGAAGYLVFVDGRYAGMTPEPGFDTKSIKAAPALEASVTPTYTVAAINRNGARGVISEPAKDLSGVEDLTVADGVVSVEYYNLQGVRVDDSYRGFAVRVTTLVNGTTVTEKVKL